MQASKSRFLLLKKINKKVAKCTRSWKKTIVQILSISAEVTVVLNLLKKMML